MAEVTIKVLKNGPYLVEGAAKVVDAAGAEFRPGAQKDAKNIALCRCGQSGSRPFCDGTHKSCGFRGEESAG